MLFAKLRKAPVSLVMYVRLSVCLPAWNNSSPTGRIFMKMRVFFENLSRNSSFIEIGQE